MLMNQPSHYHVSKWLEVLAVMITGILHLVFKSVGAKGLFIALASVSWVGYILWRVRQDSSLWVKWGFQAKNLSSAFFFAHCDICGRG